MFSVFYLVIVRKPSALGNSRFAEIEGPEDGRDLQTLLITLLLTRIARYGV